MGKLFGTDGIRGTANTYPITPEIALQVGKTIAQVFQATGAGSKKAIIGKDTRLSGYMLETAITSGLVSMGMDVLLVGPIPTPAVAHLTKSMGAAVGIMLTASHNPADDNGIKIFGADGFKLQDELESKIEELILGGEINSEHILSDKLGKAYRVDDARGRYIEFAKSTVDNESLEGLKIVLDCANGAAYSIGPLIFKELGAQLIKVNTDPDGYNINNNCGALYPENVGHLVREHGADLGVCFDGDADRVIFCDNRGTIVDGDRILGMCALDFKETGKLAGDTLVVTSMSNLGLADAMKEAGIQVEFTGVGDRYVIECMRKNGFNLGGEKSGHLIFKDFATTGDGIISALQVLKMMKRKGATLAELADCMTEYPQKLISLQVIDKKPIEELPQLSKDIEEAEAQMGEKGRVIVRYSGTENKIRLLVECSDAKVVDRWVAKMTETVKKELGA